jgi:hypothetical protein
MSIYPLRTTRQVSFKLRGRKSRISLADSNGVVIAPQLSPDAGHWYQRHLERESELHELILDSAFGGKAAASGTVAGGKIAATTGIGLAVALGGTALGAAIINYGTGDALYYGLAVAGAGIQKGMQISQQGYQQSASKLKQDLDPSISYRFVRYLPEYLWLGWSDQPIAYPVELRTPSTRIRILHPTVTGRTTVTVVQVPDAAETHSYR